MKTGVFIISAPSGSGKTTLMGKLLQELSGLHFSVSYTTRQPRGQEQNGKEYFFVTCEEFQKMIQQQDLLEWAKVFGNYYGTARRFLEEAREAGIDLLLDIDVQGASQVKEKLAEATSVFILPPSPQGTGVEAAAPKSGYRESDSEPPARRRQGNPRISSV